MVSPLTLLFVVVFVDGGICVGLSYRIKLWVSLLLLEQLDES